MLLRSVRRQRAPGHAAHRCCRQVGPVGAGCHRRAVVRRGPGSRSRRRTLHGRGHDRSVRWSGEPAGGARLHRLPRRPRRRGRRVPGLDRAADPGRRRLRGRPLPPAGAGQPGLAGHRPLVPAAGRHPGRPHSRQVRHRLGAQPGRQRARRRHRHGHGHRRQGRGSFAAVLGGAALLLLAAFAPWALFRLLPFLEAGAVAHLEGLSQRARRAATVPTRGLAQTALRAATSSALGGGPGCFSVRVWVRVRAGPTGAAGSADRPAGPLPDRPVRRQAARDRGWASGRGSGGGLRPNTARRARDGADVSGVGPLSGPGAGIPRWRARRRDVRGPWPLAARRVRGRVPIRPGAPSRAASNAGATAPIPAAATVGGAPAPSSAGPPERRPVRFVAGSRTGPVAPTDRCPTRRRARTR